MAPEPQEQHGSTGTAGSEQRATSDLRPSAARDDRDGFPSSRPSQESGSPATPTSNVHQDATPIPASARHSQDGANPARNESASAFEGAQQQVDRRGDDRRVEQQVDAARAAGATTEPSSAHGVPSSVLPRATPAAGEGEISPVGASATREASGPAWDQGRCGVEGCTGDHGAETQEIPRIAVPGVAGADDPDNLRQLLREARSDERDARSRVAALERENRKLSNLVEEQIRTCWYWSDASDPGAANGPAFSRDAAIEAAREKLGRELADRDHEIPPGSVIRHEISVWRRVLMPAFRDQAKVAVDVVVPERALEAAGEGNRA